MNNGCLRPSLHELKDSPSVKRRSRHVARLNMGEAKDDIHVCILCMRAIMNNKVLYSDLIEIKTLKYLSFISDIFSMVLIWLYSTEKQLIALRLV